MSSRNHRTVDYRFLEENILRDHSGKLCLTDEKTALKNDLRFRALSGWLVISLTRQSRRGTAGSRRKLMSSLLDILNLEHLCHQDFFF